MSLFDEQILQTARYVERMRAAGLPVRDMPARAAGGEVAPLLPFKVGPGAGPGLVLKSEAFLELGSPTAGSCAFVLMTEQTELVRGGRITVIGPDIPECAPGSTVPFGQVIIAGGPALAEAHFARMLETQHVGNRIEGFMVKSTTGRVWGRVSTDIAQRGFDFACLGTALMSIVKTQIPEVTTVEMLFVTSSKADLEPLAAIGAAAGAIGHTLKAQYWNDRGIDVSDCAFGGHCGSCPDKAVCDGVKKLARTRKALAARAGR